VLHWLTVQYQQYDHHMKLPLTALERGVTVTQRHTHTPSPFRYLTQTLPKTILTVA
jgi:hypothetical protein